APSRPTLLWSGGQAAPQPAKSPVGRGAYMRERPEKQGERTGKRHRKTWAIDLPHRGGSYAKGIRRPVRRSDGRGTVSGCRAHTAAALRAYLRRALHACRARLHDREPDVPEPF